MTASIGPEEPWRSHMVIAPPSSMSKDRLLTVEEVAERLGVNQDTVRRWIRNQELEAIDLGGRAGYRVTESALEKFIRNRIRPARDD